MEEKGAPEGPEKAGEKAGEKVGAKARERRIESRANRCRKRRTTKRSGSRVHTSICGGGVRTSAFSELVTASPGKIGLRVIIGIYLGCGSPVPFSGFEDCPVTRCREDLGGYMIDQSMEVSKIRDKVIIDIYLGRGSPVSLSAFENRLVLSCQENLGGSMIDQSMDMSKIRDKKIIRVYLEINGQRCTCNSETNLIPFLLFHIPSPQDCSVVSGRLESMEPRERMARDVGGTVRVHSSGGNGDTWDIANVSESMGGKLELIPVGRTLELIVLVSTEVNLEKVLITRLTTQKWLDVGPNWTEDEYRSAHAKMVYEYRVTCVTHYYGKGCENLCKPRDDSFGHYSCSPTGKRVCLSGWEGDYCNTRDFRLVRFDRLGLSEWMKCQERMDLNGAPFRKVRASAGGYAPFLPTMASEISISFCFLCQRAKSSHSRPAANIRGNSLSPSGEWHSRISPRSGDSKRSHKRSPKWSPGLVS
ncbi:Neurogenic locus protein delta [Eufriesea mexicana]|uniref:Delta-like protein n=1 Tax=Eufriesea mexicana TaxID=516756 RepID=A0A310SFT5_9HYME|nr:Neurogenic locus protein delta [Eufriesea mexicana]